MSKFGWSYPAGAANDPNAPYNQDDIYDNTDFQDQFPEHDSPYQLYHRIYKWGVGLTIGFTVYNEEHGVMTLYNDDLHTLGSFDDMNRDGNLITELLVSSIVEGVDEGTEEISIEWNPFQTEPDELSTQFWKACDDIADQVHSIWNETHGCETCAQHWGVAFDVECGNIQVWEDCPECFGSGIVI